MTSSPPPVHRRQINTTVVADGSSTTTSTSTTTPWSCETNWTVTHGSLESAVSFESFDFPIDLESMGPKPPLLLVPPSTSDCEPCEIKLKFTQKHKIRQIYVKSTARIYEIYYATDLQSEDEYLCTVRCGAASASAPVEENLFPETDVKNAISVNLEGTNEILPKGKVAGDNNIDDWVEIKLPVGRVDEGKTYSPNTTRNYQNYYEATAEINDSDPCTSLTLRLLSLQSKAFVHVDEIYVFADCIDTDDSQKRTVNPETSAGSSLMTMLVPTLLGLSKSRSLQLPDQHTSKAIEKPFKTESRPIAELTQCHVAASSSICDSTSGKAFSDNRPESIGHVLLADSDGIGIPDSESGATAEWTRCHVPPSTSDKEIPFHDPKAAALLEQVVTRVSRIEDMLLRFEEKMLKPINNIEARLHHVEQQLLAKKSQSSSSCPTTSEPKPEENTSPLYGDSESEDTSVAPTSTQESHHSEEKQQVMNNVFEPPKIEKLKKHVSIDDALAAALAGFSSFTKKPNDSFPVLPPEEQCLKYNNKSSFSSTESLKPTAPPECIEEEENNNEVTKSLKEETVTVDVLNNPEDLTTTYCDAIPFEIANENNKTDDEIVKQGSVEAVKVLTFDKNDILKYFPDHSPEVKVGSESGGVDFETSILEVEFACLENGNNLKSHFEAFLSDNPAPFDEGGVLKEEETTGNGLLVEIDGDDMAESDHPNVHMETSFDSLI